MLFSNKEGLIINFFKSLESLIIPLISSGVLLGFPYFFMSYPVEDSWYMLYFGAISFLIAIFISVVALYILYPIIHFFFIQDYKKEFFLSRYLIIIILPIFLLVQIIHPISIIKTDIFSLNILINYLFDFIITAIFSIILLIVIYNIFLSLGFEKEYYEDFSSTRKGMSLIPIFISGILTLACIVVLSSLQNLFTHLQIETILQIIFVYILVKIMWIAMEYFTNKYIPFLNDGNKEIPPKFIDITICIIVIVTIFGTVFIVSLFSWQESFNSFTHSPTLQGGITIDMENRYFMNNSPIYASIQMTGPDTGLLVMLKSESDNSNNTTFINLDKKNESVIYKNLDGRLLGGGRYSIIVNTTDMVTGNYVLSCIRQKYGAFKSERFYLSKN